MLWRFWNFLIITIWNGKSRVQCRVFDQLSNEAQRNKNPPKSELQCTIFSKNSYLTCHLPYVAMCIQESPSSSNPKFQMDLNSENSRQPYENINKKIHKKNVMIFRNHKYNLLENCWVFSDNLLVVLAERLWAALRVVELHTMAPHGDEGGLRKKSTSKDNLITDFVKHIFILVINFCPSYLHLWNVHISKDLLTD